MRTGLLYDFANPREWEREGSSLYKKALDQIQWAERLGIDAIWVAEHHFVDGYISSPLPMISAIAARTNRVAIGSGILVTPLYHPIRLAEELAIIDLISEGRLELGAGLGWAVNEYDRFGIDRRHRVGIMREIIEIVRLAWTQDEFSYSGQHFSFSSVRVLPKPCQSPHPPIWGGAGSPEGGRRVGRWGLGLMWLDRPVADAYLAAWDANGHPAGGARIEGYINMLLCDDPEATWRIARPHFRYQMARSSSGPRAASGFTSVQLPEPTLDDMERLRAEGKILVLTPSQAIDLIRTRTDGLPVNGIFCHNSITGLPDEVSDRHVELLATVVAPAIREFSGAEKPGGNDKGS